MHLGGGAAEQVCTTLAISSGSLMLAPVQVDLVGRDLGHDVPDAVEAGVAEQRVGVHLQRALADHRAVALVVEVARRPPRVSTNRLTRRDVGLLHRQHDVVVERLAVALDQQVVRRQAGAADAEAGLRRRRRAGRRTASRSKRLDSRDRLEVALERLLHLGAARPSPSRRTVASVGEHPHAVLEPWSSRRAGRPGSTCRALDERVAAPGRRCSPGAGRSRRRRRWSRSGRPARGRRARSARSGGGPSSSGSAFCQPISARLAAKRCRSQVKWPM